MLLSDSTESLDLPDGMEIEGLWGWSPLGIDEGRGLTGKMIRAESTKVAGQPVTLKTISIGGGYMGTVPMATVEKLQAWGAVAGKVLTLQVSASLSYPVQFRHNNGQPFEARPLLGFTYQGRADWWSVSIYLQTIQV